MLDGAISMLLALLDAKIFQATVYSVSVVTVKYQG